MAIEYFDECCDCAVPGYPCMECKAYLKWIQSEVEGVTENEQI